jgi:hypothetical protein
MATMSDPMSDFGRQRNVSRPSVGVYPHLNGAALDACFSSPITDSLSLSKRFDVTGLRAVFDLLRPRGPSYVFWLIVSVVVLPVQLVFGTWRESNISEEVFKTLYPSGADRNASSAVSFIASRARSGAAVDHVLPGGPFFRPPTGSMAVLKHRVRSGFHAAILRREVYFGKW